jgi:hypothetical protein
MQRQVGVDDPVVGVDDVRALLAQDPPQVAHGRRIRRGRRVPTLGVEVDAGEPVGRAAERVDPYPVALDRVA